MASQNHFKSNLSSDCVNANDHQKHGVEKLYRNEVNNVKTEFKKRDGIWKIPPAYFDEKTKIIDSLAEIIAELKPTINSKLIYEKKIDAFHWE